jgi:hypothetical protein
LIADLRKRVKHFGASKIIGEAISLLSMIEGAIAERPEEEIRAYDLQSGWAAAERLLLGLCRGEDEVLNLAEHLSAHLPVNCSGARVARIMILGACLSFEMDRTDRTCAMDAYASAKKLWSDLNALATEEHRRRHH